MTDYWRIAGYNVVIDRLSEQLADTEHEKEQTKLNEIISELKKLREGDYRDSSR